jgi:class 3 adenylate cyclase/tetratricopeptide (TPR) repeat protein
LAVAGERPVERRVVTVLFADLVGFTTLSERLDAEDVAAIQDAYFAAAREAVVRHGGVVEKFIGDAVMAAFGVVRSRDDDAERAVRAAFALIAAVERLNASLDLEPATLGLRVGVNTGEAVVGEPTADRGPVTGDTVNIAARLQAAAEPGAVVAGEVTALAIAEIADVEHLPPLELKGKAEPVRAARVGDLHDERSRERALGQMRAPTIGRASELARLAEAVGTTTLLVVVAPPGVGKSRLVGELAARAPGAAVLTARLRPDLLSPFEPVAQLLDSGGGGGRLAEAVADDARAAVVLELLGNVREPRPGARVEQEQLFAAWLEGLDALAAGAPALWIVEDVHWASRDLLAFLALAGTTRRDTGRTVVATARPALLEREAEWAESATVLHLDPIERADAHALVRALVGDALPPALVEKVADRSGGNALFIEELLRMWVSAGVLVADGGGWALTTPPEDAPLPPTVHAIYAGQLDDLPEAARSAARRAAVAGRRFPVDALPVLEVRAPAEALDALARRGLVAGPTTDPPLGDSYVYRHALLRDVGYASLSRAERARLHLRLADWLSGFDERAVAEVVARHYAAAVETAPRLRSELEGRPLADVRRTAAAWFERAADAAAAVAAWETAAALAARAVELTPEELAFERARRLQAQGQATASAAGVDDALPLLRGALASFRTLRRYGDVRARDAVGASGWAIGNLLRAQTSFAAAEVLAGELLAELGEPADAAVARLLVLRGLGALNARDDHAAARRDAARALEIARTVKDGEAELEAMQLRAQVESEAGNAGAALWSDLARAAQAGGRWDVVAGALRTRSSFDWDDDPGAALPVIAEAAEVARVHGLVEPLGWAGYARTEARFSLGDWDAAIAAGLEAVELAEARNLHRVAVRTWFTLRPIAIARGRVDLLERAYPLFAARRGVEPDSLYARIITTAIHLSFADAGLEPRFVPDVEHRLPSFDLDHSGPSWLAAVETIVDAWLDAGALDGAAAALDRMRATFTARSPTRLAVGTEALLRARLLARSGRIDDAVAAAAEASDVPAPWWRAKALRLRGALADDGAALREAERLEARLGVSAARDAPRAPPGPDAPRRP